MPRYLLLVVGCVCWGVAQRVPQSDCKPVKRYGIHGCDPVRNGSCPKDYDWKGVCPPNPMMKGPCVLMCVPHRKEEKKGKASPKAQSPTGQVWIPEGKFEVVSASSHGRIFLPSAKRTTKLEHYLDVTCIALQFLTMPQKHVKRLMLL